MTDARLRILLLSGGRSSEHEVSLSSGAGVLAALDPDRYDVTAVQILRDGRWQLDGQAVALAVGPDGEPALVNLSGGDPRGIDVVFPVLHGPYGEDGTIQGLCDTVGVACVGSGVAASAVAMDKALFKDLMRSHGIAQVEYVVVHASDWVADRDGVRERVRTNIGYPAFAKPARLGSSVGISRVGGTEELDAALDLALAHDSKALVERAAIGKEDEVGILGNGPAECSPVGRIVYDAEWYDYDTKYLPDMASVEVPAQIAPHVAERVQRLGVEVFGATDCRGMARIDFFATDDGEVLVSEVNTIPGFTPTSVYAKLFEAGGIPYGELLDRLIALARQDFVERSRYAS